MAVRHNAVLDTRGPVPSSVTVSASLAAVVGGGTLFGLFYLAVSLFDPTGSDQVTTITTVLAIVQVTTGVLLLVGARRFATGTGRGTLFTGGVMELLVCVAYGWYAVGEVAGDPQDGGVFFLFLGVPCGAAVMTVVSLILALLPSAAAFAVRQSTRTR
ncbi:MAG: hypothetical protein WBA97_05945 [Actinophytocola sp.]|uniref:hypothetical protein n=1 Tax=Actinophytocola sp. TaxID=1872138 RepID=UPI003C791F70